VNEPLDELYLRWLYAGVGDVRLRNSSRTYWTLLRQFYKKEFVWIVPNDDNRVEDGKDLRYEFIDACGIETVDDAWINMGCSMLEMLIALSRRLAFEAEREPRDWFWRLIENLDLEEFTDANFNNRARRHVDTVLDNVVWRLYLPDGRGGLFPLDHPAEDQRDVEIWYQLSAYLLENE
jgi:hypothetical protein